MHLIFLLLLAKIQHNTAEYSRIWRNTGNCAKGVLMHSTGLSNGRVMKAKYSGELTEWNQLMKVIWKAISASQSPSVFCLWWNVNLITICRWLHTAICAFSPVCPECPKCPVCRTNAIHNLCWPTHTVYVQFNKIYDW